MTKKKTSKKTAPQTRPAAPNTRLPLTHARTPSGNVGRWPEDVDPPAFHQRATIHPCPECRALTLDGGQAVILKATKSSPEKDGGLAYFECRACGASFKLPIK